MLERQPARRPRRVNQVRPGEVLVFGDDISTGCMCRQEEAADDPLDLHSEWHLSGRAERRANEQNKALSAVNQASGVRRGSVRAQITGWVWACLCRWLVGVLSLAGEAVLGCDACSPPRVRVQASHPPRGRRRSSRGTAADAAPRSARPRAAAGTPYRTCPWSRSRGRCPRQTRAR